MSWAWTAIGAGIGSIFGGELGILVGGGIGRYIDENLKYDEDINGLNDYEATTLEQTCAKIVIIFLTEFLKDTGKSCNSTELKFIEEIGVEISSYYSSKNTLSREKIWTVISECLANSESRISEIITLCSKEPNICFLLLDSAWRFAIKDNLIEEKELLWIEAFANEAGITESDYYTCMFPYIRLTYNTVEEDNAYATLGIQQNATLPEIKQIYKELATKYHPDKHHNADTILKELAEEKFKQVNNAYLVLLSKNEPVLWGASKNSFELVKACENLIVRCFYCLQQNRLPNNKHLDSARCPRCQRLLLFEHESASEILLSVKEKFHKKTHENISSDLETFSTYKDYINWFNLANPTKNPFTEEKFYSSMRYKKI